VSARRWSGARRTSNNTAPHSTFRGSSRYGRGRWASSISVVRSRATSGRACTATRPHLTSVVTHHLWSDTFLIDLVRLLPCIPINILTSAVRRSEEGTTGVSKQSRWKTMPCTLAHGDVTCPGADFISLCILPEPPREPRRMTKRAVAMRLFLAVIRSPVANPTGGIPRLRSTDPGGDEIALFRTV